MVINEVVGYTNRVYVKTYIYLYIYTYIYRVSSKCLPLLGKLFAVI